MRNELQIPNDVFIIGRYGGFDQFDIKIAHTAIMEIVNTNTKLFFFFVNTRKFYEHTQIIYLDKIIDPYLKTKYIK